MRRLRQTRGVRIEIEVYGRLQSLSKETGMTAADIATMSIEDCINGYRERKAVVPKVLRMMDLAEAGTEFEDDKMSIPERPTTRIDERKNQV